MSDVDIQAAQKALNKAKIHLMSRSDSAFFTTVCFSLKQVWSERIPTGATDGRHLYLNPQFFMKLDLEEQIFLLVHESMHVAYSHMLRKGDKSMKRWNYATDYVINKQLVDRGFKMIQGGLYDEQYGELSSEEVYVLLDEDMDEPNLDDLLPADGDPNQLDQDIKEILVRANVQSKMAGDKPGSVPGDIEVYLEKLLRPKLPWNRILSNFLSARFKKTEYSWRRPNRRFFPQHYLPSMNGSSLNDIAIAVDASGSVDDHQFARFVTESDAILRDLKPEKIHMVTFDTNVRGVDVVRSTQELAGVKFHGRGGTDIEPLMRWAEEAKPQCLLVFTDGEFFMDEMINPGMPVIWLIHENPTFEAPFGKVITYDID